MWLNKVQLHTHDSRVSPQTAKGPVLIMQRTGILGGSDSQHKHLTSRIVYSELQVAQVESAHPSALLSTIIDLDVHLTYSTR